MNRIVMIGAGGFARELCAWLRRSNLRDWPMAGVVTSDGVPPAKAGELPFLGSIEDYQPMGFDRFLCAVGDPVAKSRVVAQLREKGAIFATAIHETAVIGDRVVIGDGSILCPGVVVTSDIRIGEHVLLNALTSIGHDVEIGTYTTLSGHCDVTGGCTLGTGVFMGTHAAVIPARTVGSWARIGAGSLVLRHVPAFATVFGNPAKVVSHGTPRAV